VFPNKRTVGAEKEEQALQFLLKKGWNLLHKNYRCKLGEIDLIFKDEKKRVIFVEVKYRSSLDYGHPQSAVNFKKKEHCARAALAYIKEKKLEGLDFRFDVVAIMPTGIEHIPNAFSSSNYFF